VQGLLVVVKRHRMTPLKPAVLFCLNSSEVAALLVVYLPCEDVRTTLVVKLVGASSGAPVQGALSCRVAGWCRSGCRWWLGDNLLGWGPVDGLGWPPESFLWRGTALLDRLPWGRPILNGLPRWLPELLLWGWLPGCLLLWWLLLLWGWLLLEWGWPVGWWVWPPRPPREEISDALEELGVGVGRDCRQGRQQDGQR